MNKSEEIIQEFIKFKIPATVTTSIFNKELNELFDYLWNLSNKERKNKIIFCNFNLYEYVKQIGDYFEIETKITNNLPEKTIICVMNKYYFDFNNWEEI